MKDLYLVLQCMQDAVINIYKEAAEGTTSNFDWNWLFRNPHPNLISLLEQNLNKIYWVVLSLNPKSILLLLQENLD